MKPFIWRRKKTKPTHVIGCQDGGYHCKWKGYCLQLLATSWSGCWLTGGVQFENICELYTFDRANSLYVCYTPIKTWRGEWCQKRSFPLRVPLAKLLKGSRLISWPMDTEWFPQFLSSLQVCLLSHLSKYLCPQLLRFCACQRVILF